MNLNNKFETLFLKKLKTNWAYDSDARKFFEKLLIQRFIILGNPKDTDTGFDRLDHMIAFRDVPIMRNSNKVYATLFSSKERLDEFYNGMSEAKDVEFFCGTGSALIEYMLYVEDKMYKKINKTCSILFNPGSDLFHVFDASFFRELYMHVPEPLETLEIFTEERAMYKPYEMDSFINGKKTTYRALNRGELGRVASIAQPFLKKFPEVMFAYLSEMVVLTTADHYLDLGIEFHDEAREIDKFNFFIKAQDFLENLKENLNVFDVAQNNTTAKFMILNCAPIYRDRNISKSAGFN